MSQETTISIVLVIVAFVWMVKKLADSKFQNNENESESHGGAETGLVYGSGGDSDLITNNSNDGLLDPSKRYRILKGVNVDSIKASHEMVKRIFVLEMNYRNTDGVLEYFENLYLSGFLLYCIGSLDDVEMMWDAKHINMDTGSGFDIQNLVGCGVESTISFCESIGRFDICDYLNSCKGCGDFDDLDSWARSRIRYFGIDEMLYVNKCSSDQI